MQRRNQTHPSCWSPREQSLTPLQYAYRLLAQRAYSEKELEERLVGKGFTQKAVAQVVAQLKAQGYVNDASLAHEQAERLKEKGYGRRRIQEKLYYRGLAASLIDEATQEVVSAQEEIEAARRLLERRFGEGRLKDHKSQGRAFRFLISRGYPMDVAATLVGTEEEGSEN